MILVGDPMSKAQCFSTVDAITHHEAAASFDPVSRKAYLFEGWSEDLNWPTVARELGTCLMLLG